MKKRKGPSVFRIKDVVKEGKRLAKESTKIKRRKEKSRLDLLEKEVFNLKKDVKAIIRDAGHR